VSHAGAPSPSIDILCLGRAGVDLYGEQIGAPLHEVQSFAKYVGGCPANIAVGTARLGLRSAMLTRVGDDGLGQFVIEFLRGEGVDVSGIRRDPDHLTGLAIVSVQPPDRFPILFYRVECADIHLSIEDVEASRLPEARAILVSGTGLSREPSRSATKRAVALARARGVRVVLDLDYRPMLWAEGPTETARQVQSILPHVDLAVGTEEEVAVAAGAEGPRGIDRLRALCPGTVVCKLGPRGAVGWERGGPPVTVPGFPITILNTLGAGDGFLSGLLKGWLSGAPLADALRLGNAVGGIVVTRHGCAPAMPRMAEVEALIRDGRLS
jgi:5-dehydro-2-deoxygluconokinase